MKHFLLADFARRLRARPDLRRKLKVLLGVGAVALVLFIALITYVGVVGAKYVASLSSNVEVARHAETLKSKVGNVAPIDVASCLGVAQSLLNIEKLLLTPVLDNLQTLKHACFDKIMDSSTPDAESEMI